MAICICDTSALELYRSSGRLLPNVSNLARTMKADSFKAANYAEIRHDLLRFGVTGTPVHLLVRRNAKRTSFDGVVVHSRSAPLPARSILRVTSDVSVVSPEYLFLELAGRAARIGPGRRRKCDELALRKMMLVALGYELCGTYALDPVDEKGFSNFEAPLASRLRIASMLERCSNMQGAPLVRETLPLVSEGSHSPMETALAMLLTLPRALGGMGFPQAVMNGTVATSDGAKRVDLLWPQNGVGLEYKGRKYHDASQAQKDDRRENKLVGSGVTVFNVWYEDLLFPPLFEALVQDVARPLGVRVRIRSGKHAPRREMLRAVALPAASFSGRRAGLPLPFSRP